MLNIVHNFEILRFFRFTEFEYFVRHFLNIVDNLEITIFLPSSRVRVRKHRSFIRRPLSVIVYPCVIFFISDQFKILAGDQLHYKSSGKKIFRGGNHYNTPHYPLIHTPYRHICCFGLFLTCLETRSAAT